MAKGLNRSQLQAKVASAQGSITRWEDNDRIPDTKSVLRLVEVLGVNEHWLLTGEGPRYASADSRPHVMLAQGLAALDGLLFSYEWPDLPVDVVDDIVRELRAEALTPAGQVRPSSVWKLRAAQLIRERQPASQQNNRHVRR